MKKSLAAIALSLCLTFFAAASAHAAADCQFVLGFKTLRDLIGHDVVGECLEDQRYTAAGDSEQRTTGGLLVWRKADNWIAFTDGYRTWVNGPNGLEQRLNTELLPWEAARAIEALPWVRDGLTDLETRAVASLQTLAQDSSQVLRALLESEWNWLPPRYEVEVSFLDQLVAMGAVDQAGVLGLIRLAFLNTIERADVEAMRALTDELKANPAALQEALSHPALGHGAAENVAAVAALLSLKRSDPEAAAAITALPWVQDGIRSLAPGNSRGFAFELNRLHDLIDLARVSRQAFTNLVGKPSILNDFAPFARTLAVRGVPGDLWADVVIGQPDISQVSEEQVVPFKVFNPGGVVVDRSVSPGRAYIWDAGNSRILGIDLGTCYAGPGPCVADIVIGQPSGFDHSACNGDSNVQNFPYRAVATAATLCGIADTVISVDEAHTFVTMAVDAEGNLYVPDSLNNRVLKYVRPFETDTIADEVWGQQNFAGIACNRDSEGFSPTRETLCFHRSLHGGAWAASGVNIDFAGNLWVADTANHRVLRFSLNRATGRIAKHADLVLGQPDFQSKEEGNGLAELNLPAAVRTDGRGWVYVADKENDRILVYAPPLASGMAVTSVFGANFNRPTSLEFDPENRGVWVNDSNNKMIELWDWAGANVLKVLGKDSYRPDGQCGGLDLSSVPGAPGLCRSGGGIGIDAQGNLLMPVALHTQDILRFSAPIPDADSGVTALPDKRLFYPPGGINYKAARELRNGIGVAVFQDQLIAADTKRILFWNGVAGLRNGQPADGVVGETYWSPGLEECCGQIKVDGAGRLWVLGTDVTRFIDVYQLPLTADAAPIKTISTDNVSFPVLGTNERVTLGPTKYRLLGSSEWVTLGPHIRGIAPVGNGEAVWISDSYNHRVLRLRDPLGDPVVDVILGQKNAAGNMCNRRAHISAWDRPEEVTDSPEPDMLCFPGALSIDRLGNLYVSDHSLEVAGNWRLLIFAAGSIPIDNHTAVFAPAAAKVFGDLDSVEDRFFVSFWGAGHRIAVGSTWMSPQSTATWEPAFDSANRMVVGLNSYFGPRFVAYYDDPLGPSTQPSGFLRDFASMPYAATFDENDNLYVADLNRNRVLIYWNPFNNPRR